MNEIKIFNNPDFGEIRTVNIDGESWFVAKDLSEVLGYVQTNNMKSIIDEDDYKTINPQSVEFSGFLENGVTLEPNQNIKIMAIVNESGLYSAIFGSKQNNAKKFKKWVTSEVLPTLRRTGSYMMPQTNEQKIQLIAQGYVEIKQDVENVKSEIKELKDELPIFLNEAQLVTDAVKRKGVVVMGGKDADAYSDRGIRCSVYHDIYAELYRQFGITSYKALKRNQLQMALDVIKAYVPAIVVKNLVDNANNQQRLEV